MSGWTRNIKDFWSSKHENRSVRNESHGTNYPCFFKRLKDWCNAIVGLFVALQRLQFWSDHKFTVFDEAKKRPPPPPHTKKI